MHDLAQDVVDVMDHIGLGHAWVGGHAFGGSVARAVSLDHIDRVGGVLLLGVEGGGHLFPVTHVGATSWPIEDYLDWD
jgi:pimeloyl-ACP methyl ester carboxylesterase